MARILVVDDSAVVRRMLGLILEREGHEVSFAVDGQQGLRATAELHPDLVITDLEMPELDGIELVRRLRADPALAAIPIVLLTASGEEAHHRAAHEVALDGFATKPIRSTEVIELIGSLFGHRDRPIT
jgi:CheY-like chemotaxis protein